MGRAMHRWTFTVCSALLLTSFMACKKKSDEPAPAASVSPVAEAQAAAVASAQAAAAANVAAAEAAAAAASAAPIDGGAATAVLGEVKRFADKEKAASGNTKIAIDSSKVYDEPDTTKPSVTSLSKDLVVTRVATLGTDWTLIDFPSGVGKVSPGWIESKSLVGGAGLTSAVATSSAKAATSAAPPASAAPSAKSVTATTTAVPTAAATASAAKPKSKPGGILRPPSH